jgi:hypothetical protein
MAVSLIGLYALLADCARGHGRPDRVDGRRPRGPHPNARLRKALFLPTLTAIRFNPVLAGFFDRLVKGGKPKMQAVGACMRKLVMLCYGVLKNRTPFDPAWASRITR